MSFGAFAAGLAKGGLDTYAQLTEIERRKQAEARAERDLTMRETEFNRAQEERQALKDAAAQTYGRVGKEALSGNLQQDAGIGAQQAQGLQVDSGDTGFDTADRQQLADTLRANATAQGAAVPELPKYTRQQAAQDYASRLYAIDPAKAQQAEGNALTLKGAERNERYAQRVEVAMGFQQGVLSSLQKNGGDAAAVLKEMFQPLYNENKLPGLADGKTADIVPSAAGGQSIVLKDKKGNVVETMPADMNTLKKLTGLAQGLMLQSASPDMYFKVREDDRGERRIEIDEKKLKLDQDKFAEDMKLNPLKMKELEAKIRSYNADANYRNAAAKAAGAKSGNWSVLGTDSDGQPISYDRNSGTFARQDGKPIQDVSFFKKITGERPEKPAVSNADAISWLEKNQGTIVEASKDQKGKGTRLADLPADEQMDYARRILGGSVAPKGGLPDVNPKAMVKPGAAAPAGAPAAAPAAMALPQRLSQAISTDNQAGNRNQFRAIADQVEKELPGVEGQIKALTQALPLTRNPSERANLEARIEQLQQDLPIMRSILEQRRAAIGY